MLYVLMFFWVFPENQKTCKTDSKIYTLDPYQAGICVCVCLQEFWIPSALSFSPEAKWIEKIEQTVTFWYSGEWEQELFDVVLCKSYLEHFLSTDG